MPCDYEKCTQEKEKNYSLNFPGSITCEFQNCLKTFCNYQCLQIHFIEEHGKKHFNYNELNNIEKLLLKKSIEQSICGIFLEETLTSQKKRITNELNELINSQIKQINFEQIESDYNSLEYFYYFHYSHFDNPNSKKFSNSINKNGFNSINDDKENNDINNNIISNFGNSNNKNLNSYNGNNNNLQKHFTKIIGSGAFGDVYLVKNTLDGKLFAIKQLNRERVKENGIDNEIVYREINTNFKLIHSNIARLFDYYEDQKAFYLILEYVENGTLFNKIQKSSGLEEKKALKYFIQVSSAIFFLHENQLIHRDIKPENCLIDKYDNVKICDFGWAVEISKGERITFCGTFEYMAPEIIKELPYNQMIDVWSLGVLLYELIHSFSPFRVIII